MDLGGYLARQALAHPAMEPQDAVKLCYQAAFGAEHLLEDQAAAKEYFDREFAAQPADPSAPLFEEISPFACRFSLRGWKGAGLPPEWLFALFLFCRPAPLGQDAFDEGLQAAARLCREGRLPFSEEAFCAFLRAYRSAGQGAVHHSDGYRAAEQPAYRLGDSRAARLIPLLKKLHTLPQKEPLIIAIDGRAASGKSTAAGQLAHILGAGVVHMDDFFLPASLRTPERLAQPGGNVHYERFAREVLPYLCSPQGFAYPTFDCSRMELGARREVAAGPVRIVEGAYSCHPALGAYMDLRVFSHVEPGEQMARITARNGREMAEVFRQRWIPMEETYLSAFQIPQKADLQI